MPRKKKPFIDKKNAVVFHVVHRSQQDPLQADEYAGKHVLLEQGSQLCSDQETKEKRIHEQQKYGIYFEDEYDYLQHLKEVGEISELLPAPETPFGEKSSSQEPKLNLPSSVFASDVEQTIGLLNKAAPHSGPKPDWDPDIVAALDDDFDYGDLENELEDDFILKANAEPDDDKNEHMDDEDDSDNYIASDEADYTDDDDDSEKGINHNFWGDEVKSSRFTEYSMTSSVLPRNEGLALLDDRFEKMFEEYDAEEIGSLDFEDFEGRIKPDSEIFNSVLAEFERQQALTNLENVSLNGKPHMEETDSSSDEELIQIREPVKEKWDCESVLSTYSTLYNHPTLITEPKKHDPIRLKKGLGIPDDVLKKRGLTHRQLVELEKNEELGKETVDWHRPKKETPEEKRERKSAVKQHRKERRAEKKINKRAFKSEEKRLGQVLLNQQQQKRALKLNDQL